MQIRVRLFAALRVRAGKETWTEGNLPESLDVEGLKRELEARHPEWGSLGHVRAVLDTRYVSDDTPLEDGAEVALLPPVSGGSGGQGESGGSGDAPAPGNDEDLERGVFELAAEPIDVAACQARVEHRSCGAIVLFTGAVRETNRGREVDRIDYEAFAEMTGPEMSRIFERCRAEHGDADGTRPERRLRMLCVHRVGVVNVQEPSVVVAVASPHRDRAFAACRFVIDELKRSLPVWKRECYPDGEHWIGDRS